MEDHHFELLQFMYFFNILQWKYNNRVISDPFTQKLKKKCVKIYRKSVAMETLKVA